MIVPNKPLRHVQKQLDMHALRKLPTLMHPQTAMCIQPLIVRQTSRGRCIVIVETRQQPVTKGRARRFANEARLGRPLATPVLWLSVEERVEEIRLFVGERRGVIVVVNFGVVWVYTVVVAAALLSNGDGSELLVLCLEVVDVTDTESSQGCLEAMQGPRDVLFRNLN
jgi:hypothetical protein